MKTNKGITPLIVLAIILGVLVVGGGAYWAGNNKILDKKISTWNEYSNNYGNYSISYPNILKVTEMGQDNRRAVISSTNYDFSGINGVITSGYKIDITLHNFTSLDNLFSCNKSNVPASADCLLSYSEAQLVDYQKGEVTTEAIKIGDYSGIKYEFISNVGKNNNIGLVIKKDNQYYVVLIAYSKDKDLELYNKILNSFKFNNQVLVEKKDEKVEQNKEMSLIYNNKKYLFVNSECKIGGTINRGIETWGMSVGLTEKDNNYGAKNIFFNFYSNENNIESYLKNNKNIATKGVQISNNLTSSTYSDKVSDDAYVVWNEINTKNNTFSGNGYIEIKKDRKPNVGICNGTEIVNQKYITPNDPEYKYMCPSPVIPIQKIYFKCSNGVIYRTPSGMTY